MNDEPPIIALDLSPGELSPETRAYFAKCEEKLGLVPNVLKAYAWDETKLRAFTDMYNDLMLGDSPLSKLERELIAVTVSAANRCHYCVVAHGAALRALSGDPAMVETLVVNHRAARLEPRHRAIVDYAFALTVAPQTMVPHTVAAPGVASPTTAQQSGGPDIYAPLRAVGLDDRAIWDITAVAAFFNMTNRVATATAMAPNADYHQMAR